MPPRPSPAVFPAPPPPAPAAPRPARERPPPRPVSPARRQAQAGAGRQLALAAAILLAGAVAWRLLTAGPHGWIVVTLAPAAGTSAADGDVLVDGLESGTPGAPIRAIPGRHLIGLAAGAWTTPPVAIRLRAGETRPVLLRPIPHHAELSLDTVPSGALLALRGPRQDGRAPRGLGRAPAELALPPGAYRLTATLPGYRPLDQALALRPGERRILSLALLAEPPRVLHLLAPPAGNWSAPVALPSGDRFTLAFQGRIRVRAEGRVMLLDNDRSDLGALAGGLQLSAVGDAPVPVDLLARHPGSGPHADPRADPRADPHADPHADPGG